jgi:hypothetical protein
LNIEPIGPLQVNVHLGAVVPRYASDIPRYPAKLFEPKFFGDLKAVVANKDGKSPAIRLRYFYMRIWNTAYHSILHDEDMSQNPYFQDYIQEHIQMFKWLDWNGEKMSDEKGKTWALQVVIPPFHQLRL